MNKTVSVVSALSVVAVIIGGIWLSNQSDKSAIPKIDGIVLPVARPLQDFQFQDHQQKAFSTNNLRGKWHLMFFGYIHCPDICTPTLNTLNLAVEKMTEAEKSMLAVVFVSVDPARDSTAALAKFMQHFNADFIGVTAKDDSLKDFAQHVSMPYAKSDTPAANADGRYLMDHSARILLINPRAELQAYLRSPKSPQALLDSIRKTQRFYNNTQTAK